VVVYETGVRQVIRVDVLPRPGVVVRERLHRVADVAVLCLRRRRVETGDGRLQTFLRRTAVAGLGRVVQDRRLTRRASGVGQLRDRRDRRRGGHDEYATDNHHQQRHDDAPDGQALALLTALAGLDQSDDAEDEAEGCEQERQDKAGDRQSVGALLLRRAAVGRTTGRIAVGRT